jgi:hypothetical protein
MRLHQQEHLAVENAKVAAAHGNLGAAIDHMMRKPDILLLLDQTIKARRSSSGNASSARAARDLTGVDRRRCECRVHPSAPMFNGSIA